jgi:ferredoxin
MTRRTSLGLKALRIASQASFLGILLFIYIRSLDPFAVMENPFLVFDPLIFLTNPRFDFTHLLPPLALPALTVLLGRFFCGWVCPMGTVVELLDFLASPIRKRNPAALGKRGRGRALAAFPPAVALLAAVLLTVFSSPSLLPFFHPNVWIVQIFSLSAAGLAFLGLLALFSLFGRRLWCIYLCPLGALYGILSRFSPLRLKITSCSGCGKCNRCPMMAAEHRERLILSHQCILCFDYEHDCPTSGFSYGPIGKVSGGDKKADMHAASGFNRSRRDFLALGAGLIGGAIGGSAVAALGAPSRSAPLTPAPLRPPGVVDEEMFLHRCVRCLHCVQSCPNKVIFVTGLETGVAGLFTPHLRFHENGCDFNCQVCQLVCPNQAIPLQSLPQKQVTPIGLAAIDREKCVVYAQGKPCLVCEEVCPTPEKAVVFERKAAPAGSRVAVLNYPSVIRPRCIGCGICQAKCPAEKTAIIVSKA